ncbi:hypothetical protein ACTTZI_004222 [Vibrio vulnificus]
MSTIQTANEISSCNSNAVFDDCVFSQGFHPFNSFMYGNCPESVYIYENGDLIIPAICSGIEGAAKKVAEQLNIEPEEVKVFITHYNKVSIMQQALQNKELPIAMGYVVKLDD